MRWDAQKTIGKNCRHWISTLYRSMTRIGGANKIWQWKPKNSNGLNFKPKWKNCDTTDMENDMTRKQKRQRAALVDFMQFVAVTIIVVTAASAFMFGLVHWFAKVDCHNATQALAFIERCEADANCTLRPHDVNLRESMTRLKIRSCPAD